MNRHVYLVHFGYLFDLSWREKRYQRCVKRVLRRFVRQKHSYGSCKTLEISFVIAFAYCCSIVDCSATITRRLT